MIAGLNTRNLGEDEVKRYEDLSAAVEDAELDQLDAVAALREKYVLPEEAGIDAQSGVFVIKDRRVAGNKHATIEEREQLYKLANAVSRAKIALRRCIAELRKHCQAPSHAKLNSHYKWVTPEGEAIVEDEGSEAAADAAASANDNEAASSCGCNGGCDCNEPAPRPATWDQDRANEENPRA